MKKGRIGGCAGIFISIALLLLSMVFILFTIGPVMGRVQHGVKDIYDFTPDEIQKNRYAQMTPLTVYDCFYTTYSKDSDTGEITIDNYYYAVYYDSNEVLIVKTRPDTNNEYRMDRMLNGSPGETIEGVFSPLTSEVNRAFNEWLEYESDLELFPKDIKVCTYVLDCSNSFTATLVTFIIACVVFIATILFWVAFIITAAKGGKNNILPQMPGTSYIPEQTNSTPSQGVTLPKIDNTFLYQNNTPPETNVPSIRQGDIRSYNPYDMNK